MKYLVHLYSHRVSCTPLAELDHLTTLSISYQVFTEVKVNIGGYFTSREAKRRGKHPPNISIHKLNNKGTRDKRFPSESV